MMESIFPVTIWFAVGVILLVLEMFTPGFFLASIAVGAFLASATARLGGEPIYQLLAFIIGGGISLISIRPVFKKYLQANGAKTNADGMIGKYSVVENNVNPNEHFYAKIDGVSWDCLCPNSLSMGDKIRVVSLDSAVLITEKIEFK
jgi:membrane protein implicated in regulation of membrane protease activity